MSHKTGSGDWVIVGTTPPTLKEMLHIYIYILYKSKAIPITGRGGLQGCEMLRIPHCLDSRLTDGDKVVSPRHWLHSTLQKHNFSASGTHCC
jgi:hypothetical protein